MNKILEKLKIIQELCICKGISLGTAESCTGGMISNNITNLTNSSEFYKGSIIAYSNDIKIEILRVPESLLRKHGAVSEQVCEAMASGLLNILKIDVAIAITGLMEANDELSSKNEQAFVTIKSHDAVLSAKIELGHERLVNKEKTSIFVINTLHDFIQKNYLLS